MSEKKTFINPNQFGKDRSYTIWDEHKGHSITFMGTEWDMEVTFTKKENPFVPGWYQNQTDWAEIVYFYAKPKNPSNWSKVKVARAFD